MGKWLAGIIGAVITGVLIFWLTEGLQSPGSTPPEPQNGASGPPVAGGAISVRCSAQPHLLHPGDQTDLVVQAISSQNTPISDANVRVEAGGGTFLSSNSTTVLGRTDQGGSFRTTWRSPSPAAAGYVMAVTVSKQGLATGKVECRTIIQ